MRKHQSIEQAIADDIARCEKGRQFRVSDLAKRHSHSQRHYHSPSTSSLDERDSSSRSIKSPGKEHCHSPASLPSRELGYGSYRESRNSSAAEEETEDR